MPKNRVKLRCAATLTLDRVVVPLSEAPESASEVMSYSGPPKKKKRKHSPCPSTTLLKADGGHSALGQLLL